MGYCLADWCIWPFLEVWPRPTRGPGALYMSLFGVGTIPLMTAAVYFSSLLKGGTKKTVQRLIPIIVVIIGLLFILRGLGLGIPYISPEPVMEVVSSQIDCH